MSEKSRPGVGRRVPTPMPPPNDSGQSNQQRSTRKGSPASLSNLHNTRIVFAENWEHYIEVRNSTPKMDRNGLFFNTPSTAKKKKINLIESRQPQLAFYDEKRPGFARRIDFKAVDVGSTNANAMRGSHPQGDIMKAQYVPRAKLNTQLESYQPKYHAIRDVDRRVIEDVGKKVRKRIDSPRHVREERSFGNSSYRSTTKCASGSPHRRKRSSCAEEESPAAPGGYCAALQKGHPSAPPALLRRLGVKEPTGMGKVKVMLRVGASGEGPFSSPSQKFSLDKRKKQVSLYENTTSSTAAPEDRKVGVAAPKMFAFDAIFSQDDAQTEICSSALTDVIHAVVNGTDGCLLCFGHAGLGKSYTMLGRPDTPANLGAIPCAITWLFKGIAEQKHKCGTKFSVRVSAVELCTNTNQIRDLLAPYQNDSEQSPGVYLRDDPLFGTHLQNQSELRAHSAEKAAFYLDAALATRGSREEGKDSHLLFTLHVYQYNIAAGGKGAVAGGRSRLHLIDLGNTERGKSTGGIPFSGLGNILLAIFNGQRHLPYKDHSLTHVLKECLGSLTCHTAMIVHVSPTIQNYSDTLTTLQLASRIHRLRRRKIKFPSNNNPGSGGSSGEEAKPSSSEPDPSSSDLSADTVIYVGPIDDATDGEHPPVYIPHINSGDNRCVMSKALRGSVAERHKPSLSKVVEEKSPTHKLHLTSKSPLLKTTTHSSNNTPKSSPVHCSSSKSTPMKKAPKHFLDDSRNKSPFHKNIDGTSDEQWIDGPRISKSKLVEARHIIKETHEKKLETWIDGPIKNNLHMETVSLQHNMASLQLGVLSSQGNVSLGYGYMDNHKKNMIRKWVENQTSQIHKSKHSNKSSHQNIKETLKQNEDSELNPTHLIKEASKRHVEESTIRTGLKSGSKGHAIEEENFTANCNQTKKSFLTEKSTLKSELDDDDDSEEMAEIPPALPLIKTLSSREVSMESLDKNYQGRIRMDTDIVSNRSCNVAANSVCKGLDEEEDEILEIVEIEEHLELVPMQDCSLQVTEEDIALAMGLQYLEYQDDSEHPLKILSQENLTIASTFTDTISLYSDLERQMKNESYLRRTLDFFTENFTCDSTLHDLGAPLSEHTSRSKIDELIGLVDLYARTGTNQMDPTVFMRMNPQFQSLSNVRDTEEYHGNGSVYSEPAYKPSDKICDSCKRTMSRPGSAAGECSEYQHLDEINPEDFGPFERYRDHRDMTDARIASLRHPDGASDPNLREEKKQPEKVTPLCTFRELKSNLHLEVKPTVITTEPKSEKADKIGKTGVGRLVASSKPDGYDSGHESTPRTGKHSPAGTSRRAESGYDSVPRDSDASSLESYPTRRAAVARAHAKKHTTAKYKQHSDRSFCSWLKNPFTCKYVDTDPEVSDF